jgi:hypothetical protein
MKGMVCILLLVLVAGCLSSPSGEGGGIPGTSPIGSPAGAPTLTYAPEPSFEVTLVEPLERRYEIDAPCYWVAEVQAVNTGGEDARNVIIHCTFIDTKTGDEKTQNELFSRFNKGERKVFEKRFEGDCDGSYRMEFSVDYDRG